jgi:FkbM family methyltransferase
MPQVMPSAMRRQALLSIPFRPWWWRELLANVTAIALKHPRQFAALARAWLALALQVYSRGTRQRSSTVSVEAFGQNMEIAVADPSDVRALIEIFILGTYEWAFEDPIQTIVDAGAHIGGTTLWFAARYPHARIVAIEPHPDTFARLRGNTEGLTNVELVAAALHAKEGNVELFGGEQSWAASLVPAKNLRTCHSVRAITLDRLVRDHNLERIDILKLNIEGSETAVLRSTGVLDRVRTIVFEYHDELADMPLDELLNSLAGFEVRRLQRHSPGHVVVVAERSSSDATPTQTQQRGTV